MRWPISINFKYLTRHEIDHKYFLHLYFLITQSSLSADPGPDRGRGRQAPFQHSIIPLSQYPMFPLFHPSNTSYEKKSMGSVLNEGVSEEFALP